MSLFLRFNASFFSLKKNGAIPLTAQLLKVKIFVVTAATIESHIHDFFHKLNMVHCFSLMQHPFTLDVMVAHKAKNDGATTSTSSNRITQPNLK